MLKKRIFLAMSLMILAATNAEMAEAQEFSEVEKCLRSCQDDYLREVLRCGRVQVGCILKAEYFPWWSSSWLIHACDTEFEACELYAQAARLDCQAACYREETARLQKEAQNIN